MTSGGQFERLIREGQILAFEPDLLVWAKLSFWYFPGDLVERHFRLLPSLHRQLHPLFHSRDRGFLAPSVIQSWEVS